MTSHVPELKKSWTPLKVLATITRGFFRSRTPLETRAPRSRPERTPRTRRLSICRQRSPSYALILGEVGQEVKGARGEYGPSERAAVGERVGRGLDRDDLLEVRCGPLGQVRGGQSADAAGARRDECVPDGRERGEHAVDVLVGEDRGHEHVASPRQARQQVPDRAEVVSAVPDLE